MSNSHISTRFLIFGFVLLFNILGLSAQETMVYGFIKDENNNPIKDVHVITKNRKTFSDNEGYYELKLLSDFKYTIEFSSIAHKPYKFKIELQDGESKSKDILLETKVVEIEIELEAEKGENRHDNVTEIDASQIKNVAGGGGSVESLIKQTTAIAGSNELSSQYSVRGGNFDENLIYVNGFQIYRPFLIRSGQQEGLSFLNSDMVESIRFSAGGFNAEYGDKLSSVLDIKYRDAKAFGVKANLSFQGGGLTIENPFKIGEKTLSFIGSYRYKSPAFLLNSLETQGDYRPKFHDFQTYLKYDLSPVTELSFLGNYSKNRYQFIPESRTSSFGTASDVKQVYVFFEGQEIDEYESTNSALKLDHRLDEDKLISFQASHFRTLEQEFYDIDGYYQLGIVDNNPGSPTYGDVTSITGVGEFLDHARNEFYGEVSNLNHRGVFEFKSSQSKLSWGLDYQYEHIEDQLNEWQYIDSLGFSINDHSNNLELYEFVNKSNKINSWRTFGFAQFEKKINNKEKKTALTYNVGIRGNYWNLNDEFFVTPRANVSYKPNWKKDMIFRFSAGMYNQSPFYRELRDAKGQLNKDAKSQKSFQTVLSNDYHFIFWDRKFKMTTELYYKNLWDVLPYEIDNLQIKYLPFEQAKAYTYGLEWRINGELVEGNESYLSMAYMQSKEDIIGDGFGYIPKPTEQAFVLNLFYQDHFVNNKNVKFHLAGSYSSGRPFGSPGSVRGNQTLKMPSYKRVDVGFSKAIKRKDEKKSNFLRHFKEAWVSVEILNLLNINNTANHLWVRDAKQTQYAVPNYLTGRLLNIRLNVEF